ncbi:neck protein [Vibrio phage 1.060.A._10N.261.48.B5]|nr:neck protein [Vibrio phage 1.060.A._10N.261.48.B5]
MSNEFDDAADWLQDEVDYDVEELAMNCLSEFVNLSPVDTGRFRNNWLVTINKETTRTRDEIASDPYKLGQAVIKRALKAGADIDYIMIQNNIDYANVIDTGLYPNPVKVGSRTNETGTRANPITPIYEKLSESGFSKQAPNGITRPGIKAALERSKGR